ncbi:GspMb/PilO family protein, partial [Pseudomonas syringae group genomosp. 7]|uniref:GspMb/PilO family protein n=1 Tax=Pseudomonas syringae group genomosp. 7 TaxID=251699 RepID=UPI0037704871
EPYLQIKRRLTLERAIEPLMAIMHELEYQRPYLFVEEMRLHRNPSAPLNGGAGNLAAQMLESGYMQPATIVQVAP